MIVCYSIPNKCKYWLLLACNVVVLLTVSVGPRRQQCHVMRAVQTVEHSLADKFTRMELLRFIQLSFC